MRITKNIRLQELGPEFALLAQKIRESAHSTLEIPWMVVAAKSFCPVNTGALMDSIRSERRGPYTVTIIAGGGGIINPQTGREVNYAGFVHDGTSKTPPRPFLMQAVIQERPRFAREMMNQTAEAL